MRPRKALRRQSYTSLSDSFPFKKIDPQPTSTPFQPSKKLEKVGKNPPPTPTNHLLPTFPTLFPTSHKRDLSATRSSGSCCDSSKWAPAELSSSGSQGRISRLEGMVCLGCFFADLLMLVVSLIEFISCFCSSESKVFCMGFLLVRLCCSSACIAFSVRLLSAFKCPRRLLLPPLKEFVGRVKMISL